MDLTPDCPLIICPKPLDYDFCRLIIIIIIIIITSTKLWPSAELLTRPTFGELWSQNCLKKEHVL